MSKKNKKTRNPKSYGSHGGMNGMGYAKREHGSSDRNAKTKTAGLTVNINKLSLHMDERMTTTYDNHSFHPVDGSHYCGNEVSESNRYGNDHDHCGCGFHHIEPEDYADEFCGAPCIDMNELAESISEKLKIDVSTVMDVLVAEEDYLEERGLSIPLYEDEDDETDEEDGEDGSDAVNAATDTDREKEAENNGN